MTSLGRNVVVWLLGMVAVAGAFYFARSLNTKIGIGAKDQPVIAASIYPVYSLVKEIVGDEAEVILLVPPGANEHTFEPSPATIKNIAQAQVVFTVGQGLDDWINKQAEAVGRQPVVTLDSGVNLIQDDPHYWLSPTEAATMIDTITATLIEISPAHQVEWQNRSVVFKDQLEELTKNYQTIFIEAGLISIATYHNAFAYLARDFGFTVATTFEEIPGEEPSPAWVANFQQTVADRNIKVVYAEPQSSQQSLESIAADAGVSIKTLDPLGGGPGRISYQDLLRYNLDLILNNR